MSDLYRLVYTSRNHVPGVEDEQSASVSGILAVSKRNNARVGVTGALLFSAGSFAQVLEGPRAAVETTFERIQRDPRHSDVSVLQCEPVTTRGFPNWSMAFVGRSPRGRALWDEVARRSDFDISRLEGDRLFATLLAIVEEEEGGAEARAGVGDPGVKGLDVERLRTELHPQIAAKRAVADFGDAPAAASRPGRPYGAAVVPPPRQDPEADGTAAAVLRVALDEERARTTALRRELDVARVDLAASRAEVADIGRLRDVWAERARAMAAVIVREPELGNRDVEGASKADRLSVVR